MAQNKCDGRCAKDECVCPTTDTADKHAETLYDVTGDPAYKLETVPTTDEGWEEQLRLRVRFDRNQDREVCILFIEQLLQKEREKVEISAGRDNYNHAFEAGKSEAFSLVRKIATEMKENDWKNLHMVALVVSIILIIGFGIAPFA